MISIYNRYAGNSGKYYRVDDRPEKPRSDQNAPSPGQPHHDPLGSEPSPGHAPPLQHEPPPRHDPPPNHGPSPLLSFFGQSFKKPPGKFLGGLGESLNGMLPFGFETGDLLLLLMVFLLYTESGDEEFLIILAALAYSLYKSHADQRKDSTR